MPKLLTSDPFVTLCILGLRACAVPRPALSPPSQGLTGASDPPPPALPPQTDHLLTAPRHNTLVTSLRGHYDIDVLLRLVPVSHYLSVWY